MLEAIVEDAERASDLDASIPVLVLGVGCGDLAHVCRENVVAASNRNGVGLSGAGVYDLQALVHFFFNFKIVSQMGRKRRVCTRTNGMESKYAT